MFVHDDGESDATVLLGDLGWEPRRVSDAGGVPDAGDLILNDEERAFVSACWIATAWRLKTLGLALSDICRERVSGVEVQASCEVEFDLAGQRVAISAGVEVGELVAVDVEL